MKLANVGGGGSSDICGVRPVSQPNARPLHCSAAPVVLLPPHKHTGEVHAFTLAGEWSYLEHPDNPPNRAGSYLYEPPGSTHTLKVADHAKEETDVVFVVYGAMIHYGPNGEILAVGDAESHLRDWPEALRAQGQRVPPSLPVGGTMRYRGLRG